VAAEEQTVRIVAWPEEPARLEHRFEVHEPCPVSISFTDTPAVVVVTSEPERPLDVRMRMQVVAAEPVPVCISVCEPICATSDYAVGLTAFDQPVATISVRGTTRLERCSERPPPERVCVDFVDLKAGTEFAQPLSVGGLRFSSLGGPLRASAAGDPAGRMKLAFPDQGFRVDFRRRVNDVQLTVNNYGQPEIELTVHSVAAPPVVLTERFHNEARTIDVPTADVTAIELRGGSNEAALVEICFTPAQL
jgi:hypothetical protein